MTTLSMPRPAMPFLISALLTVAALAGAVDAQSASPANQVLVLAKGKSGKVTVKAPCKVLFDTPPISPGIVSFKQGPDKPGVSRSWKLTAIGNPGQKGFFRVNIAPTVPNCDSEESLLFQVLVVRDPRETERDFVNGDKKSNPPITGLRGHVKQLKSDLKKITKAHDFVIALTLQQLKDGDVVLPPFIPPMPGDPPALSGGEPIGVGGGLNTPERALAALGVSEFFVLDRAETVYFEALQNGAAEGAKILLESGYQQQLAFSTPPAFVPGEQGAWDVHVRTCRLLLATAAAKIGASSAKAHKAIEKLSAARDEPLFVYALPLDFPDPGDGGVSPISGPVADPTLNMGLSLVSVKAWNRLTVGGFDTSNGRFMVLGRTNVPSVFLNMRRVDFFGEYVGGPEFSGVAVDLATQQFLAFFPLQADEGSLAPGTWQLMVQATDVDPAWAKPVVPTR